MTTRSRCDKCHHVLFWYDLLPLFSFLVNRGKCRYCGEKITVLCFAYEFLSGLVLFYLYVIKGMFWNTFVLFAVFEISLVISYTDMAIYEIPDLCIIILIFAGLTVCDSYLDTLMSGSLMASYIYVLSFVVNLIYKKQMIGMGDIKLLFVSGMFLGFYKALLCLLVSCTLAFLYVLFSKRKLIPFGPFISFSMFVFLLLK